MNARSQKQIKKISGDASTISWLSVISMVVGTIVLTFGLIGETDWRTSRHSINEELVWAGAILVSWPPLLLLHLAIQALWIYTALNQCGDGGVEQRSDE